MQRQKTTVDGAHDLPVRACLPALREVLAERHAVLTAEPGSGKTTLVPLLLLDEPWLADSGIVMLEPRRPAARMAAHRMAQLLGEEAGETVGYLTRLDTKRGPGTRVLVMTEAIFVP